MAIGASSNFPSLESIANLVRAFVDDDKRGATATPGEGQILTDTSTTLQNFMDSAIREVRREVGIMGQPTLIRDNYLLLGLPPVNSSLGIGVMNPAVQVSLTFTGFFDGLEINPTFTLPADLLQPLELWERMAGTQSPFGMMTESIGALTPRNQVTALGEWENRSNAIWMNGATSFRDLRIRYLGSFPALVSATINWSQTFVPIPDAQEAIADKIAVRYARRLGSPQVPDLIQQADRSMLRLRQQVTRSRQRIDNRRPLYGEGKTGSTVSNVLY